MLKEQNLLKRKLQEIDLLFQLEGDLDTLLEFDSEGEDVVSEFQKTSQKFSELLDKIEIETLLYEKDDPNNAILTIHPGAGGTESQDWASILYRMYLRYSERNGYKVDLLDYQDGDTAGIKSVTMLIKGDYAYGYLKQKAVSIGL